MPAPANTSTVFDPLSSNAPNSASAFEWLLFSCSALAGLLHVAFGTLFYGDGAMAMVWFNVGSVLCYLCSTWLIKRQRLGWAMLLMGTEVVAHCVTSVIVVGWNAGFHFYLIPAILIILANQLSHWWIKIVYAALTCAIYVWLDLQYRNATPLHLLDALELARLHTFNLLLMLGMLSGLTVVYVRLVNAAEKRLHELATTDTLTQLMNRRSVLQALEREQARRVRKPTPMALILVDIDHFKKVNDTWGHNMGDWALAAVAGVLKEGLREMDFVARWGGEEFLVVLPLADAETAWPVAERLRLMISQLRFVTAEHPLRVTATLGLTQVGIDEPVHLAIQRADAALYRGKNEGRNRVVVG